MSSVLDSAFLGNPFGTFGVRLCEAGSAQGGCRSHIRCLFLHCWRFLRPVRDNDHMFSSHSNNYGAHPPFRPLIRSLSCHSCTPWSFKLSFALYNFCMPSSSAAHPPHRSAFAASIEVRIRPTCCFKCYFCGQLPRSGNGPTLLKRTIILTFIISTLGYLPRVRPRIWWIPAQPLRAWPRVSKLDTEQSARVARRTTTETCTVR
jgi:hypothetical protein